MKQGISDKNPLDGSENNLQKEEDGNKSSSSSFEKILSFEDSDEQNDIIDEDL